MFAEWQRIVKSVTTQRLETSESKTREEVQVQEQPVETSRWKRIVIDAALLLVVVFCVAELAIRLLHR